MILMAMEDLTATEMEDTTIMEMEKTALKKSAVFYLKLKQIIKGE